MSWAFSQQPDAGQQTRMAGQLAPPLQQTPRPLHTSPVAHPASASPHVVRQTFPLDACTQACVFEQDGVSELPHAGTSTTTESIASRRAAGRSACIAKSLHRADSTRSPLRVSRSPMMGGPQAAGTMLERSCVRDGVGVAAPTGVDSRDALRARRAAVPDGRLRRCGGQDPQHCGLSMRCRGSRLCGLPSCGFGSGRREQR